MRGGPQDPSCADTHPGALGDPHSAVLTPTFCPPPSLGPEAECDLQGSQRGAPYARAGSPSVCPIPTATPLGWALPTAGGIHIAVRRREAKSKGEKKRSFLASHDCFGGFYPRDPCSLLCPGGRQGDLLREPSQPEVTLKDWSHLHLLTGQASSRSRGTEGWTSGHPPMQADGN